MTPTEQRLHDLLNELFRFDRSDLDFGIYRIMNLKRDQVQHFMDVDLLPQIRQVLERTGKEQNGDLEIQLAKAREGARLAGLPNPDEAPMVKELLGKYKAGQVVEEQERQVFGHLYEFFHRYYKDGDFIPQARYKKGVYALPYEGEEVKLSWANQDQYYIKTSEELRDYSFVLSDKRLVHFRVVQAEEDRDNNKAQQDKDRRLILASDNPVSEENGELIIRFEYRPDEDARKQDDINDTTVVAVIANPVAATWKLSLQAPKPGSDTGVLAYHLRQYTARNTFDYFIHKDLGGFLRRELDFYLKNEILDFDTLAEPGAMQSLQQQFGVARAVQQVGGKIIDFLAQLEDFEKKLWLKKKFVVRTDWCVTLDRVPHELYVQVAANAEQVEEWKRLFAVQDIAGDTTSPGFTEPPSITFLEHNPYLVVDTRFFDQAFKDTLLASFSDLDEQTDGLLIHSENFQALELLQERYRGQVGCTYIDPPYNLGDGGFNYKDNYRHSTWASMMADRLQLGRNLQRDSSAVFASMDDGEQCLLRYIMSQVYGDKNLINNIIWQKKFSPSNDATWLSDNHDFIVTFAKDKKVWRPGLLLRSDAANASYKNPDNDPRGPWSSGDLSAKTYSAATDYPVTLPSGRIANPPRGRSWIVSKEEFKRLVADNRIWLGKHGNNGTPRLKQFVSEVKDGVTALTLWTYDEVGHTQEARQQLLSFFDSKTGPTSEQLSITTPKPTRLIGRIVTVSNTPENGVILDYFSGSGTTAQAVVDLNRSNGSRRKYVLVEMGDFFDTILKPRIEKVIYSKDWKDGRPVSREGSSHMFKYMTLESYDDTLANLELKPDGLFEDASQAHEQYMLRYMLETETQGSPSLLNTAAFSNPFAYTLKVAHGPETVETVVDLVETFNYLIGLRVHKVDMIRGIRVVQGVSPAGERVLVLWRNVHDVDADQLNEWFTKQGYNTRDTEFDIIYVNGDNHLQNLRRADQTWKVRLIEPDFQRLMFDVQDV